MKQEYKISNVQIGLLVGTAVLIDGIQALLTLTVIGSVFAVFLSVFAAMSFFLWFASLHINYFGKGAAIKMLASLGTLVAELIPIISGLPAITAGVVTLIVQSRIEDMQKGGGAVDAKKLTSVARLARAAVSRSNPLAAAALARTAKTTAPRPVSRPAPTPHAAAQAPEPA